MPNIMSSPIATSLAALAAIVVLTPSLASAHSWQTCAQAVYKSCVYNGGTHHRCSEEGLILCNGHGHGVTPEITAHRLKRFVNPAPARPMTPGLKPAR